MERRAFLVALAAGLTGIAVGRGTAGLVAVPAAAAETVEPAAAPAAASAPPRPAGITPVPPPTGVVSELPGAPAALALTIDDGTSSDVVSAYCRFAEDSGVRLTFFPNGCYRSWKENAPALRRLLESGQAVLGNHTWSHPDLTTLPDRQVAEEITRNRQFLQNTFGAGSTPFMRPPFGATNDRVARIAADCGHPTVVLWDGSIDNGQVVTEVELLDLARECFTPGAVVLGHANHDAVTRTYAQLLDLLHERQLETVTLADVWSAPA